MSFDDQTVEKYEHYEEAFDPIHIDRQARRTQRPRYKLHTRRKPIEVVADLTDQIDSDLDGGFETTYRPSRHEAEWLLSSLRPFYDQALVADVLALVKGGKEASVYRCRAHPSVGVELLAAKVYRPRRFRSLSNDSAYREGREVLTEEGQVVKKTEHRIMRALGKKSTFGEQVAHSSWLQYEYAALLQLHAAGAAVPRPYAAAPNAILMSYHGDEAMAAPTLSEIALERQEAEALFGQVMRTVELLLAQGWIHGDLSAYNILYWEGEITVIDFPQVVSSRANRQAQAMLGRDIERICQYFARQGVVRSPVKITRRLWDKYAAVPIRDRLADESAREAESEE